jgi:hypothetical protein
MLKDRRELVEEAIERIRDFHKIGLDLGPKRQHRDVYGKGIIDKMAKKKSGENADTLRKARQFADPIDGYTPAELSELCKYIANEQPGQDDGKQIFRRTHILRLVSVRPKKLRKRMERRAIKEEWSTAELETAISLECGTRKGGGRRRRIPREQTAFLAGLERMAEGWRRWHCEVERIVNEGKGSSPLESVSRKLQGQIVEVSACLAALHQQVNAELHRLHPSRAARPLRPTNMRGTKSR